MPDQAVLTLPAGTVSASVTAAGQTATLLGPKDLTVAEGADTIVYAWGSAEDKNLDLAVQTITGLHSAPGGVPSGTGGLLDDSLPGPLLALTIGGLACIGVAGAGAGSSLRRRRIATRA